MDAHAERMRQIGGELETLARHDKLTGPQETRYHELRTEWSALERAQHLDELRAAIARPDTRIEAGTPPAVHDDDGDSPDRGGEFGEAHRAIDRAARTGALPDHAAQRATLLVDGGLARDRSVAARWATRTGDPAYAAAFVKVCADPERGHLLWTERERAAFAAVQEFRAMSLTDTAGGYMVPLHLDPAIMLTSGGSASRLRQAARVVTIATDVWHGVTSAGVTAHWHAEAAEVEDDSPTLAQPSIPTHRGDAFIPFSFEVGMDSVNFTAEMQKLLVDGADQLQTTAYTTGTGQSKGVITALTGGVSVLAAATAEQFTAPDVYALQAALPPRFSGAARWMGNIATINQAAQFETTAGARLFPEIGAGQLLRKPLDELSTMDATINAAATESNHVLLYGDFTAGMVIVDRIGTTIELIPNLMGANRRPTLQRGLLLWFRTGSDVVVPNAFRLLNITTTA